MTELQSLGSGHRFTIYKSKVPLSYSDAQNRCALKKLRLAHKDDMSDHDHLLVKKTDFLCTNWVYPWVLKIKTLRDFVVSRKSSLLESIEKGHQILVRGLFPAESGGGIQTSSGNVQVRKSCKVRETRELINEMNKF